MMRFLLVEAAHVTLRRVPEWRRYLDLTMRRGRPASWQFARTG